MVRKLLSMAMFLMIILCVNAQQMPQMPQLPLNPKVKHGVLPNGLNYYILHNEEPKQRANFYIAQKVGSSLETEEQLGLAHFLEHMAFNGTKNYPGKNMLNYLQSKGIRFGADINAYTGFDETVYNINNIPTNDQPLIDSVLLVLRDWSCDILLEESEINAERGVIEEEWRSRNDADTRMYTHILPLIYEEYQYQQMPIGKMEIVRNFKPEVLRAYYHKWYRPDQQGIIIVGDFDADAMEAKVKEMFTSIPMPENAAPRVYPTVSHNEKPIYAYFEDPELRFPMVRVSFKEDKLPAEMRNTELGLQVDVLKNIFSQLINNRLSEYAQKPECKYAQAGVYFGNYYVSKTMDSFNVVVIAKGDVKESFEDAMAVVARACKTGFTDSELSRVRDQMLANYDKLYNERDKTNSESLAQELIRTFTDSEPNMGIEAEYNWVKQVLPMIPVQAINQLGGQILTANDQVIVVSQPKKEGIEVITEDVMVTSLANVINGQYEAYVDEVITDPLIPALPAPGSIKSTKENPAFGTTEFILSNGVKVIVKPTDFTSDEIVMTAFSDGGKRSFKPEQGPDVKLLEDAVSLSKLGQFDNNTLRKYLAGKNVSLAFEVANTVNDFSGRSTVKHLPTLMELVYAYFTDVNPDKQTFDAQMDKAKSIFENQQKSPRKIFSDSISSTRYGGNPLMTAVTPETFEKADYDRMLSMYKKAVSNAADFTFIFTGNVNLDSIRPLLEQYIATLPSTGKKNKVAQLSSLENVGGQVKNMFKLPMLTPSTQVLDIYSDNNIPYNIENSVKVELVGDILGNVFTETLREEEGGTYSPYAGAGISPYTGQWQILYNFETNKDMQAKLIERADAELKKLLEQGASADAFKKVKEAALKQYENNVRTNSYWDNNLLLIERGIDNVTGHRAAIENVTLEDINAFMKKLNTGKNRIQVIMEGVEAN